jgi:hypothetical protein
MPKLLYLNVDKEDFELYTEFRKAGVSGDSEDVRTAFMLALVTGFRNRIEPEIGAKKSYWRTEYISNEDRALINAIAIISKGISVLENQEELYQAIEKYAHGGIKLLNEKMKASQAGTFIKSIETELYKMYDELDIDNEDEKDTT